MNNIVIIITISSGIITNIGNNILPSDFIIPSIIGNTTITGIGDDIFNQKSLVNLTFPSTLTTIGNNAFSNNQIMQLNYRNVQFV